MLLKKHISSGMPKEAADMDTCADMASPLVTTALLLKHSSAVFKQDRVLGAEWSWSKCERGLDRKVWWTVEPEPIPFFSRTVILPNLSNRHISGEKTVSNPCQSGHQQILKSLKKGIEFNS